MNEVTPDLIARIATRLYNELPAANCVPKTEAEASGAVAEGAVLPARATGLLSAENLPFAVEIPAASSIESRSSGPASTAGLAAFAQRARAPFGAKKGHCSSGLDPDFHHRLFGGKPPIVEQARPFDVAAIRKDFPILHQEVHGKPLVWLDNAATTQKPQSVIDALTRFHQHDNSNIHRGAHALAARATDAYEQARQKVQAFLGASSAKEIIFVRGSTEGINLVAQTDGRKFLQQGDEIVLSTLEHHADIVPWQMVAKERGAVLRVIPVTDRGEIMLEEYEALLGPRTRLVAITHASNSLGTILPVAEMTQMPKANRRFGPCESGLTISVQSKCPLDRTSKCLTSTSRECDSDYYRLTPRLRQGGWGKRLP
jgi:cysteine desulfurase/selenocysteine lyase